MRKNPLAFILIGAPICAAFLAMPAAAQDVPAAQPQDDSVADAARRARALKKAEGPAKQVWTDENIPKVPREEAVAEKAEGDSSAATGDAAAADKDAKPTKAEDDAKKAAAKEAEWRQKFADARKKLDDDEKDLDLMQRELNLKRQQYFSDPNTALRDQYQRDAGPGGGGEVNTLTQKIDDQKKKIDQDHQAIDDLEEGLRRAGLPPGWSRP
jgi:hypothetical protein